MTAFMQIRAVTRGRRFRRKTEEGRGHSDCGAAKSLTFAGVVIRPRRRAPLSTNSIPYRSLDFALIGRFRKIFSTTKPAEIVKNCTQMFNCFPYKNMLQNVDINFLLTILNRIIFYAIAMSKRCCIYMN